ncbi:MAG: hypothetical protein CMN56_03260 [Sneathiella sp.]|uniref:ABC transporter substrate-binding protein n=1 Tax=Sneathiella sp. TaxID=1964365 RepID=UPI000C38B7F1|nr:ABC transporter substrate-binding protein [Sneathiella sp.]MAZ02135.1 hypothetical protein [Sneathiella sp.]
MGTFRRLTLALALSALTVGETVAQTDNRGARAEAAILAISEKAKSILSQRSKPLAEREKLLVATIGRNFHFTLIAELVIGPSWEKLPHDQRQEFLDLFRDFFLSSYGSQLGGYPDDRFVIQSVAEKGARDSFVRTTLTRPKRETITLDWRLREVLGRPLIIDLLINGTSVAISHRESFNLVLSSDGMEGLLTLFKIRAERLNAETRDFAAGEDLFEQGRFAEAVAIWEELARKGDAKAQYNLSVMYDQGRGVEPDSVTAHFWNKKARAANYPPAIHNHALTLLAAKEEAAAISLLEKSAENNFAPSQYTLGKMYSYGIGVKEDAARAFGYIRLAAEAGLPAAQYNLGKAYRDGYGTEADNVASVEWFEKSALQGHGRAQEKLATRYGKGEGVPQNDVEALKWAILAAREEIIEAAEWEKLYRSRMSKADITRAETLANNFKPQ